MMRVLLAILISICAVPALADDGKQVSVPGWISFSIPEGYSATTSDNIIVVSPDSASRTPLVVTFRRNLRTAMLLSDQIRQTPMGGLAWQIRNMGGGGSGGDEWRLTIKFGGSELASAVQQREGGQPSFAIVWDMFDSMQRLPAE